MKKTTPPNHAMAVTMCRNASAEITAWSANAGNRAIRLVKLEPNGAIVHLSTSAGVAKEMVTKSIQVLRLGQRYVRDDRTLTHLCLVSRALGAELIYLEDAEKDVTGTLEGVKRTWGGEFKIVLGTPWTKVIRDAKKEGRSVVHLTMYGEPLQEVVPRLRGIERVLLVVGGPKVPGKMYREADYNVAVTSQPHSEIAALAIVLHEVQSGEELKRTFHKTRLRILPTAHGKRVVEN
jgi:tRNA (cytidine56-2'-O)-methyltransferase